MNPCHAVYSCVAGVCKLGRLNYIRREVSGMAREIRARGTGNTWRVQHLGPIQKSPLFLGPSSRPQFSRFWLRARNWEEVWSRECVGPILLKHLLRKVLSVRILIFLSGITQPYAHLEVGGSEKKNTFFAQHLDKERRTRPHLVSSLSFFLFNPKRFENR